MSKAKIIPLLVAALSAGSVALAQTDQVIPTPMGARVMPSEPVAMATPANIPGGLYRIGNGYLSCLDTNSRGPMAKRQFGIETSSRTWLSIWVKSCRTNRVLAPSR